MSVQEERLKAVADAIREKEGSSGPIPAKDFPARILALPESGLPEDVCTIDLQASNPEGGTISKGGVVSEGMTVQAIAEPKSGYAFNGWQENGQTVSLDTEYTFQVAKDRFLTAMFEEVVLPTGYTKFGYLQSSGTQYIDTGFKPSANTRVVLNFSMTSVSKSLYCYGCGSSYVIVRGFAQSGGKGIQIFFNDQSHQFSVDMSGLVSIDQNKHICTINGESFAFDEATFTLDYNFLLFTTSDRGTANTTRAASMKLFSCKIYENGVLMRDFVPCKNPSGVAGLYDLAEGKFYGNSGTGAFTAGPAV